MQALTNILKHLSHFEIIGNAELDFNKIAFDSRKVEKGDLFVAVKGVNVDGHQFIDRAIAAGACAIVCETVPSLDTDLEIAFIKVPNSAEALGLLGHAFFGQPSQQFKLVGVTGTNGKTTTATLLYDLFSAMGYKVGLISTVENRIAGKIIPSEFTTPDALSLSELLKEMVDEGCEYAFMEVSSHSIHQRRIAGLHFTGALFTNLSHDHLDYHKTFKEYIYAKKRFFDDLPKDAFALTNIDDRQGDIMVQNTKAEVHRYSLRKLTDFKAKIIDNSLGGLQLELDGEDFYSHLIGEFNAYNLLSVYATARLLKGEKLEVLTKLSQLKAAEGRFDYVRNRQTGVLGIVDYSHTPDALEKVLSTLQKLRKGKEQIITVVGCGGDRDKRKRPIMAKTACHYSNQVIITSDNPRTEDPQTIIEEMEKGIPANAVNKVLSISDRKSAIKTACKLAQKGDLILVAGKGHEKYQEINGVKHPFDDKEILKNALGINDEPNPSF